MTTAPPIAADPVREFPRDLTWLRKLLWLYLALWVAEGALRKWVLPGLAAPLLVVRDPLLLYMYYLAFTQGIFPRGKLVACIIGLGLIAILISTAATDTPLVIALFGLRASYMHLLLIFLIPNIFTLEDVVRVGRWTLLVAGPMAVLVLLQFVAGRGSWLNAGAGGSAGGMIESAYGHIRPSGTFSFTNGLSGYTAIVAAFFLYHLLEKSVYPRLIWLAAAPSLVVLVVLSGSRAGAGLVALIIGSVAFISIVHRRYRGAALRVGALCGAGFLGLGSVAVFKQGLMVFAYRFGDAANVRSGFLGRFLESFQVPFLVAGQTPTFGVGLGMGTNVAGGVLLGHAAFLLAEGELARNIMESGALIGGLYLGLRAILTFYVGSQALRSLWRDVNVLPLMIFSGCCIDLLEGQFSQATELGFATIAGGLCLAATRRAPEPTPATVAAVPMHRGAPPFRGTADPAHPPRPVPVAATPNVKPTAVRGRSVYAERLHAISAENPEKPPI